MNIQFRVPTIHMLLAAVTLSASVAAAAWGCAGGSAYASGYGKTTGGGQMNCVAAIAPATSEIVGVNLTSQTSCTDPTYQLVEGYFGGSSATSSHVVSVTHSPSNAIAFMNLDSQPHTAASLGAWTGSYPSTPPNAAATPSPAGTDISAAGFTTGNLNPGTTSSNYLADVPGVYVIGCAYHYLSNEMRTVIIVM